MSQQPVFEGGGDENFAGERSPANQILLRTDCIRYPLTLSENPQIRSDGFHSRLSQGAKRTVDLLGSLALLTILMPILFVVAAAVAFEGRPVLFKHRRVGRTGRIFGMLKFRTMVPDSEGTLQKHLAYDPDARHEWNQSSKLRNDPRVTRLGRFLRVTSMDELPQLINVVRGDMSLVGPRPVTSQELRQYYGTNDAYYLRMRPGMTGLWQISGRSECTYEQRVKFDIDYVRNWSFWTDVVIVVRTLPVVMNRRGAY